MTAAGGRLREVRIDRLADSTFFASAVVEGPGIAHVVDARPSDALNLALMTGAPILVASTVIDATEGSSGEEDKRQLAEATVGRANIADQVRMEWAARSRQKA